MSASTKQCVAIAARLRRDDQSRELLLGSPRSLATGFGRGVNGASVVGSDDHTQTQRNERGRIVAVAPAGFQHVEANSVARTATVTCDPSRTSLNDHRRWTMAYAYHGAGESLPDHVCMSMNGHGGTAQSAMDHSAMDLTPGARRPAVSASYLV